MTDCIKKPKERFTIVENKLLYDNNISLKAKGIYAYLYSKPDGWQFHPKAIQKELKESKNTINSSINELIKFGYIKRTRFKDAKGRLGGSVYEFSPGLKKPEQGKSLVGDFKPYSNTELISNTDKRVTLKTPIPPQEVGVIKECVDWLYKIAKYHTGRSNHNTDRWGSSLWRWMVKNNIPSNRVRDVLEVYYDRLGGDDEYMPRVRDLREFFIKFNRLEDLFTS